MVWKSPTTSQQQPRQLRRSEERREPHFYTRPYARVWFTIQTPPALRSWAYQALILDFLSFSFFFLSSNNHHHNSLTHSHTHSSIILRLIAPSRFAVLACFSDCSGSIIAKALVSSFPHCSSFLRSHRHRSSALIARHSHNPAGPMESLAKIMTHLAQQDEQRARTVDSCCITDLTLAGVAKAIRDGICKNIIIMSGAGIRYLL
jgi:hypothetical protein